MNKLIAVALISIFSASVALAQAPAAATAKTDTKKTEVAAPAPAPAGDTCEAKAIDKNGKPLAGAAKAASIKKCERESKAAEAKTAKTAQQEKMKTCNKEATGKKGDERKKFMSECLKK